MKQVTLILALGALLTIIATPGRAETPVVVELFTSQGCSSCPPADALLLELAEDEEVLALAFHIDYWDRLGWPDPFAAPWASARQRDYAPLLGNGRRVYTPQMVIDGRHDVVGSRRGDVAAAIRASRDGAATRPEVRLHRDADSHLTIDLPRLEAGGRLLLFPYLARRSTEVRRGENAGRRLVEGNIVTAAVDLGAWDGTAGTRRLPRDVAPPAQGVAVLVQDPATGHLRAVGHLPPALD